MKTKTINAKRTDKNNAAIRRKRERAQGDSAFLGRPKQVHDRLRAADVRALARSLRSLADQMEEAEKDEYTAQVRAALRRQVAEGRT
jgi:hypothetical protein